MPTHPCRRSYNATALSSNGRRQRELALLAMTSKRCLGARHARLCHASLSDDLGLTATLPAYTDAQRHSLLRRFEHAGVKRSGIRPTPWLSLRRPIEDPPWLVPSWLWPQPPAARGGASSASSSAAFFYGNEYVDLSLFTHFFAQPAAVVDGTYVEIGGSNGVHASNTLFFEQHLNWSGVLIEPTPCGRCLLPHTRPRDLTINAGACTIPANLTFGHATQRQSAARGAGADDMAKAFCPSPQDACVARSAGGYRAYLSPCLPMHSLLPKTLAHVDLLSVDVEGRVLQVLQTMPWQRTAVDVVLAECRGSALVKACSQLLRQHGFRTLPHMGFGGDVLAVREACLV